MFAGDGKKSWVNRLLSRRNSRLRVSQSENIFNPDQLQELKTCMYQIKTLLVAKVSIARIQFLLNELRVKMQSGLVHNLQGGGRLIKEFREVESQIEIVSKNSQPSVNNSSIVDIIKKLEEQSGENKKIHENLLSKYLVVMKSPLLQGSFENIDEIEAKQFQQMKVFVEVYRDVEDYYNSLLEEQSIASHLIEKAAEFPERHSEVEVQILNKRLELVESEIAFLQERKGNLVSATFEKELLEKSTNLYSRVTTMGDMAYKSQECKDFASVFSKKIIQKSELPNINMKFSSKSNSLSI